MCKDADLTDQTNDNSLNPSGCSDSKPTAAHDRADEDSARDQHAKRVPNFDVDHFLKGLDAIFDAHQAATQAEPYVRQAKAAAKDAGDEAGLLTVLNETMGLYRSHGRHQANRAIIQEALQLAKNMGLEGSEAWTTTLINAATAMRAGGHYDQARNLYQQALESASSTLPPTDRRLAALHNNMSMLYSETRQAAKAEEELNKALAILESSSVNPREDTDIASTHTNLALVLLDRVQAGTDTKQTTHLLALAESHARQALEVYRQGHLEHSAHYASALAGYGQVAFRMGHFAQAVENYRHSLAIIEECYGKDSDYYRTTKDNLEEVEQSAASPAQGCMVTTGFDKDRPTTNPSQTDQPRISGLQLSKAYWEHYGKPLLASKYPQFQQRVSAGLVGHGSECYGFDDEYSRDHDFGPGFCLWLTAEDYQSIGQSLQKDYEALPAQFLGFGPRESTARAGGAGRRVGVFEIGAFFEQLTGYRSAPPANKPHEWLMLDEATLAAATNGQIFADPLGAFSQRRQGFKMMPDDVRLALISRRLGMAAQAGQYNLQRMWKREDGPAAWLSIREFVNAVSSLVFLVNQPISVGYMPYYKWQFAALRKLSSRMAARLPEVCQQLESILRMSSAACFGGAAFGEGGKGSLPARQEISDSVESVCKTVVSELKREGLTCSDEMFLEWQRPYVEEHIISQSPSLHSI